MKIYLDTAQIYDLIQHKLSASTIAKLKQQRSIRFVFSSAHNDDAVMANEQTDEQIRTIIFRTQNSLIALPGVLLPRVEMERFVDSWQKTCAPPQSAPQVLFENLDQMFSAYPDYFEVRDLQGKNKEYRIARKARMNQKLLWAKAIQHAKQPLEQSISLSNDDLAWIMGFLSQTQGKPTLEEEQRWQKCRSMWLEYIPEGKALPDINAAIDQLVPRLPEIERVFFQKLVEFRKKWTQALRLDNRVELLELITSSRQMNSSFAKALNPLSLPVDSKKLAFYSRFRGWLPAEKLKTLLSDLCFLSKIFCSWLKAKESCAAGLIWREVEWALMQNVKASITPSEETDLWHIALLPYVDFLFADKRIVDAINRCTDIPLNFKQRCIRNGDFERWIQTNF